MGSARSVRTTLALVVWVLAAAACNTGRNYTDPVAPRYAGGRASPPAASSSVDTLKVVTFNVMYGQDVDGALAVLTEEPALAGADVVLLQEMEERGTREIAEALGMAWVYYPATFRYGSDQDFGNAVLSRWPIVSDAKIILPYRAIFGRTQRTATVATIDVRGTPVRVYSVHLATIVNASLQQRAEQMRAVFRDASSHPYVILGGDLNNHRLGHLGTERGYSWPTRSGPWTATVGRFDHILLRGLDPVVPDGTGTVLDNRDSSDHRPVWALAVVR